MSRFEKIKPVKPLVYNWNKAETRIEQLEAENTRLVGQVIRLQNDLQYYKELVSELRRKDR